MPLILFFFVCVWFECVARAREKENYCLLWSLCVRVLLFFLSVCVFCGQDSGLKWSFSVWQMRWLQKESTAVWGGKGWGLSTDDPHFSEGEKAQFRRAKVIVFHLSRFIPILKTFPTFYFSFYSFHRKWLLLSILGPVAQIYVDFSNENSTTSPNICRTAVRPFSLSLFYTSPFLTFSSSTIFSSFIFYYLFFQSPNLGRCGFHTWCEMLFLQRLLTHVCNVFFWGLDLS